MKGDHVYLRHILDAIRAIERHLRDVKRQAFLKNFTVQDAVIRQLCVLGEAASKVSSPFRKAHPTVPFSHMIGLRHRLIHDYIAVDMTIVWETCQHDLPILLSAVKKLLARS